jgi:hypothetical protein
MPNLIKRPLWPLFLGIWIAIGTNEFVAHAVLAVTLAAGISLGTTGLRIVGQIILDALFDGPIRTATILFCIGLDEWTGFSRKGNAGIEFQVATEKAW